jgi:peptidoglycan/LPS O-acetylase OafA/YrhL
MHWAALAFVILILFLCPKIHSDMPGRFTELQLLWNFLLMQNWGWGKPFPWNVPTWSLSTEWLVSLLFPLFLFVARRPKPQLAPYLCALCLAAFAIFLVVTNNPDPNVPGRAGVVRTVCEFAAGCLLYRVYDAGITVNRKAALVGMALISIGLSSPALAIVAVFGFPITILLAARPGNPVSTVLASPIMLFLGEISYSIYLLHWIMLQASDRIETTFEVHGVLALLWFFAFVALLLSLSTATYYFIEMPTRRLLRGGTPKRAAVAPVAFDHELIAASDADLKLRQYPAV